MKKKEPAEPAAVLSIPAMKLAVFELVLKGVSPLVTHKFSAQSQKAIEDKQQQKPGMKKAAKDPDAEFRGGMHEVPGRPGVHASTPKTSRGVRATYAELSTCSGTSFRSWTRTTGRWCLS